MTCGCSMSGAWGWFMGPLGLVVMVGFWALLIWGGITLYRAWAGGRLAGGRAEDVLARRFAAGEVSEDEYQERLDTLRSARDQREPWPWGANR